MKKSNVTTSPFSFVNAINNGKSMIREDAFPEERESQYIPYITNKAFSNHYDTILYSNNMNMYHGLDNIMQFEYYLNSVRKRNRPGTWYKAKKTEDHIKAIAEYYDVNVTIAAKYADLMTKSELASLLDLGGQDK